MVTYDPNLGIFYRTTKQKSCQYHVQYFGISAIRGWVTNKSCVLFSNAAEREFDVKSLSKKVRAEYEVAIQEVNEAQGLNYNQRKLKFIFSFGPPRRGGKRNKNSSSAGESSLVQPVFEEAKERKGNLSRPEEIKQEEQKTVSSSRSKSKKLSVSSRGSSPDLASATKHSRSTSQVQPSSKTRKRSLSSSSDTHDKKMASKSKKLCSQTLPTQDTRPNGKQRIEKVASPPCLHDQHSKKGSSGKRRSSSESSFRECEQCMEYICGSDSRQLKCTSEPEKVKALDFEASSKPIVMYVQKEYGSNKKGTKSSTLHPKVASLLPSHVPLTKGVPTKNMATEVTSSVQESSRSVSSTRQPAARGSGQPHPNRLRNSLSSAPSKPLCSSMSSLSTEGGYETGRNGQSVSTSGLLGGKRKRRGSVRDVSSSSLVPSSLLQVQSKPLNEAGNEVGPTTRRSKYGRASSLSTSCLEDATVKEVESSAEDFGLPVAKRMHSVNRRHSEQMYLLARRSSRVKDLATSDSIGSSAESSGTSVNDSCSEASLTPIVLSPTASSPAESSSMEVDSVVVAFSSAVTSSKVVRKKVKQNPQPASDISNICSICECEDTDLLVCQGHCSNSFHLDCLGLVENPSFNFVCDECLIFSGTCFVCSKAHGEVQQCSKSKCSKLYHLECINNNKLFQFGKASSFICSLHVCAKCTSIGGLSSCSVQSRSLLQCVKCPLALHQPDCLVAGCEVLDHSHMLCYQHVKITRNAKLYTHINLNTCLECGAIGSLYCCDVCSAAYHLECLDEVSRPTGESSFWKCPSCAVHDLPAYKSLVITKFGKWR